MLEEGVRAPDFSVKGDDGRQYRLSDFSGKKVVLYFYPKDDTPGCTTEACSFRDSLPDISGRNAVIIGVSRDGIDDHRKFKSKYGLNFLLLSDEDSDICGKYGVLREKNMYGRKSIGIQRSTFIIDEKGMIAKVFPTVKPDGHGKEIMQFL
ncbi:MAG: thioredoxin-dependent thiol peroxidase [Thermoplasmata archaeon]|nr:thioredoxin-dependent thiol peroxidase [Candidatus Sysuiplasma acidicola]MBX8645278.1 thioredoxin-dependent thiol peroxidase [Candidatus Sysuiplasma acidicola]MDH2906190.1 thioredoxin-dependent thiol peroxidase [Methanomassiliicoccales archaeon]